MHNLKEPLEELHFSPVVCCNGGYIRPEALRSVGLLDVLSKYACGGLGRAPGLERRLLRFATTTGEKCGLGDE